MRMSFTRGVYTVDPAGWRAEKSVTESGFRYTIAKGWHTKDPGIAARLRAFADDSAKDQIDRTCLKFTPWTGAIPYPKDKDPRAWQLAAAQFALTRNRSYLALDRRLGKLITSVLISNARPTQPIVYLTRPFLTYNVIDKFREWGTGRQRAAHLLDFYTFGEGADDADVVVVPDSRVTDPVFGQVVKEFVRGRKARLIVDEAHRYKELTSDRARALFGVNEDGKQLPVSWISWFSDVTFLSGTPAPNRSMEYYGVLSSCAANLIEGMSRVQFGQKYCGGRFDGRAWVFKGDTKTEELAEKVKPFMMRLRKEEVGFKAPVEEMVCIDGDLPPEIQPLDRELLREFSPEDLLKAALAPNAAIATYRKLLGKAKVPFAARFIDDLLQDADEKIILFGFHREVIAELAELLKHWRPFVITGATPSKLRSQYQNEFLNKPRRRLLIGNMHACGEGLDLYKATRVVFCEWDWVPGMNDQAKDRMFHIEKSLDVYSQYLVFKNSMDRKLLETDLRKRKTLKHL